MKATLLLLASIVATNFVSRNQIQEDWAPVSTYLSAHSIDYDPNIDARLCEEAMAGEQTWLTTADPLALRPTQPGVGWPSESAVLHFPTAAERNTATSMILDITYQRRLRN